MRGRISKNQNGREKREEDELSFGKRHKYGNDGKKHLRVLENLSTTKVEGKESTFFQLRGRMMRGREVSEDR